ncbi:type II toxin-antitoxin system PemK/MazF family toxin [Lederbergia sp. NSJ-179]|uniref:type II toxin-antitoxin system PemK/MazF family toxin n=1 Tax=Lederbergia sp. NSJ-179 TaxID=2931402 RepID=UPI001FCFCC9C|nr:type II toxin-antitoxin system PemK/MazF family toxin [Lederbergia sp. NSJ-179]MCJ7841974.1 type II toxin-antitoxin system PemK/MazF family toxin [Lederbergia sp. NSJ-179]
MNIPEKGDLVFMNFSPQSGHEQAGQRPGIVLSPYEFNEKTKFAIVCPITSKVKGYPFEVELPEDVSIQGVILTDQLRSIDYRSRDFEIAEKAPEIIVERCFKKIRTFL